MGLSGLVGAGAQDALAELLQRQMIEQQLAERTRQFDEEQARRRAELAQQDRQFTTNIEESRAERAQAGEERAATRRERMNIEGLRQMDRDRETWETEQAGRQRDEAIQKLPPEIAERIRVIGALGGKVSGEDLETPDARAARERADEDATVRRAGRVAEAQAAAAARHRKPDTPAGPGGLSGAQLTSAKQFQDDYYRDSKTYITVRNGYQQVASAASRPDAAGDLSLIFGYMKMLDPNSVVRETEFANAQNAAGVPDQIRNLYNRAMSGERLNPNQRAQFVGQARRIMEMAHANQAKVRQTYGKRATQFGLDPAMVLDEEDQVDAIAGTAPAPGGPSNVDAILQKYGVKRVP